MLHAQNKERATINFCGIAKLARKGLERRSKSYSGTRRVREKTCGNILSERNLEIFQDFLFNLKTFDQITVKISLQITKRENQ